MLKYKNLKNAEQGHKKTPSPWRLIVPTLLSLCLCVVCLFGATWAWFTVRVDGNVASIQSASFAVDVQVVDSAQATSAAPLPSVNSDNSEGMIFELTADTTYQVTLTANGTAKTGYCKVSLNDQSHPTVALASGTTLTFRVSTDSASKLSFEAYWGVYNGAEPQLTGGCLLTPNGIATNGVTAVKDAPATTEPSVTEATEAATGTTEPTEAPTEAPAAATTEPQTTVQPSESPAPATSETAKPAD